MCKDQFFDVRVYSGSIANFAGVIGAIIIAAIALRLGTPPPLERRARTSVHREATRKRAKARLGDLARPLLAMPVALVGAFLGSYGYSVVSATPQCDVGSEIGYFAGAQLGLSAALLLFAVVWLLRDYETHGHAVQNAKVILIGSSIVVAFYLAVAIGDYHSALGQDTDLGEWLATSLPLGIPLGAAILLTWGEWVSSGLRTERRSVLTRTARRLTHMRAQLMASWPAGVRSVQRTMLGAIGAILLATIGEGYFNTTSPGPLPLALWAVYSGVVSVVLGALLLQTPTRDDQIAPADYAALRGGSRDDADDDPADDLAGD